MTTISHSYNRKSANTNQHWNRRFKSWK